MRDQATHRTRRWPWQSKAPSQTLQQNSPPDPDYRISHNASTHSPELTQQPQTGSEVSSADKGIQQALGPATTPKISESTLTREYLWTSQQQIHFTVPEQISLAPSETQEPGVAAPQLLSNDPTTSIAARIQEELATRGISDALLAYELPDKDLQIVAEIAAGTLQFPYRSSTDQQSPGQLIPCVLVDLTPDTLRMLHVELLATQRSLADPILSSSSDLQATIPGKRGRKPRSQTIANSSSPSPSRRRKASSTGLTDVEDEHDEDSLDDEGSPTSKRSQSNGDSVSIYDESAIIHAAMTHFRESGFPFRALPPFVCMQRINKLAQTTDERLLRTTVGVDVADTYHPHRFMARGQNKPSPFDAFQQDKSLERALRLRYQDNGRLTTDYPTTLNLITRAVSNFRPGFATYLYRRYCKPGAIVLDPCTGYGGRLVGFLASGIADPNPQSDGTGHYIGFDPSTQTYQGNLRLAQELGFGANVRLFNLAIEDALEQFDQLGLQEICDFSLTSPPYFSVEHYSDEPTQSDVRYSTPQAWRNGFLLPLIQFTARALKPGAYALFNVDDVQFRNNFVPLIDWTCEAAGDAGFRYVETITFPLRTRCGSGTDASTVDMEPILVFQKPFPGLQPELQSAAPQAERETPSIAPATDALPPQPKVSIPSPASGYRRDPASLIYWMSRLYARTADERTIVGRMGLWPIELAPYIIGLCRCHSTETYGDPPELTFAPRLLSWDKFRLKPVRPKTCLLLFSGGKDSLAAGIRAQHAGYSVIAVTLMKINHSYPQEVHNAQQMAHLMGWEHRILLPQHLPKTLGESVVKNQYALAFALDTLEFMPEAYAIGNYKIEDCHTTSWWSDMERAIETFDLALQSMQIPDGATGLPTVSSKMPGTTEIQGDAKSYEPQELLATEWAGSPRRLPPVMDPLESLRVWCEAPAQVRALTTSCMTPARYKQRLHDKNVAAGVPLHPYECGSCEKDWVKAVLLTDQIGWPNLPFQDSETQSGTSERPYPEAYLRHARERLGNLFTHPLWCHIHPTLETPALPPGESHRYLWETTFGGRLIPRRIHRSKQEIADRSEVLLAREPVVNYLNS